MKVFLHTPHKAAALRQATSSSAQVVLQRQVRCILKHVSRSDALGGVPEGDEGSTLVVLKFAPVHPPSDGVSGIGGPPQHHGGTPVILKQRTILAQESGVRALEDLPGAVRPQGPYEKLPKEAHELVALVWLQQNSTASVTKLMNFDLQLDNTHSANTNS